MIKTEFKSNNEINFEAWIISLSVKTITSTMYHTHNFNEMVHGPCAHPAMGTDDMKRRKCQWRERKTSS